MGAKQSKRSVDISGKEGEGGGEVAAAGAGGEGRVEPLADHDGDARKPQVNGDAHIQAPAEPTEKEKQLDSGTPENEKDATTEKEGKEKENGSEKETVPVTNGESEQKENGDSTPAIDDGKKPKKEKVKKKWSLRSISFSRKDKPKQEKKQKEEEAKTNGEPDKVPEEAIEATPDSVENKMPEEDKPNETKDDKNPETPVTEPITNGSSTPETPKVESPSNEPEHVATIPETERPQPKAEIEPEQLPINGLAIEEPKEETIVLPTSEENKPDESTGEATTPAPEIPVKIEEPLPVSDKLAELIADVPAVPELKTDMLQETTSDVAVAN